MPFLPEDVVVTQILPRLAVKTLFKFKSVSKRYNAIISSPRFAQHYLQRAYSCREPQFSPPGLVCGLLLPSVNWSFEDKKNIKDLNGDNDADSNDDDIIGSIHLYSVSLPVNFSHRSNDILFSSNGLVLVRFEAEHWRYRLFVSNPLTKQCVPLPYPPTFSTNCDSAYFLATRRRRHQEGSENDDAFLSYKVMIFHFDIDIDGISTIIVRFSSDTGTWTAREVSFPTGVSLSCIYSSSRSHNGIMHWLKCERGGGAILTYDPFDSPDRFGQIPLPNGLYGLSSLIYSGDDEAVRLCDIKMNPECVSNGKGDCLRVWRLVEGSEWCLEREVVDSVPRGFSCRFPRGIMAAPNPRNSHLVSTLLSMLSMQTRSYTILDLRDLTWKVIAVDLLATCQGKPLERRRLESTFSLVPIQLCPWSSPFYDLR